MGMGGIYAQIFKDISIALVPLDVSDAEAMIKSLRIYPLLKGIRGRSGVDLSAIMRILLALSQLAMDYPEIMELDLDPVFATTEGCRCADSRIVFC